MVVIASISFADEHFPSLGKISHGPVNVRTGANTNFEIVSKLAQGDQVVLLGKSYEWYKIQLPDAANAYIRADYIKEIGDHGGEIIGSKVNVRCKPDSNASIFGQLVKGDIVKLVVKANDWWQIQPPSNSVAWVHSSFVKIEDAQFPATALRKPLKVEDVVPVVKKEPPKAPEVFHAQGQLRTLVDDTLEGVHYKIVAGGQTICYVKDEDKLSQFQNAQVMIEGIEDKTHPLLSSPLVAINKISLVL